MAYVTPNYVKLNKMPDPKKEYNMSFPTLDGGLNLMELDYRISTDESPEMKNLQYREGVLSCRDGQVWVLYKGTVEGKEVDVQWPMEDGFVTCYNRIWNGKMIIHANGRIKVVEPDTGKRVTIYPESGSKSDFTVSGKFFPYNEKLYYKTYGYYIEISYDEDEGFSAKDVEGYIPVTYINCSPTNGSGTVYQPENRISSKKTLWYNAGHTLVATPNVSTLSVAVEDSSFRSKQNNPGTYVFSYTDKWRLNGADVDLLDYGITVGGTPVSGNTITVVYKFIQDYKLPISSDSLTNINVDGKALEKEDYKITYYKVDHEENTLEFTWSVWKSHDFPTGVYRYTYNDLLDPPSWTNSAGEPVDMESLGYKITGIQKRGYYVENDYTKGDYLLDRSDKTTVHFVDAPKVTFPETNNTVRITYSLEDSKAYSTIMDCTIAEVYGGTGDLVVVFAGSKVQPNAYYWSGNSMYGMDASYFPIDQSQLSSDFTDPVVAFGKQQGYLIIFNEGSVGRTTSEIDEVNDRSVVSLPYVPINAKIGCDLPNSVQLIENNLVWCNTEQGVHFLANTSAAYENNIICLSQKVNTSSHSYNLGLLYDVRNAKNVCSVDANDERYWLNVDGHVWVWDYQVSTYKNPAWFYFTNIQALGYVNEIGHETNTSELWQFDRYGRLTHFERCYSDHGGPIDKQFRFATQYFSTYDTLKNINSVIINTRSDTNSVVDLEYITDYESRKDKTPLEALSWVLYPRNLKYRSLKGSGFAYVFRRRPMCRRVQYFTMKLTNNTNGMDMNIVSAQIYYTYQGKKR